MHNSLRKECCLKVETVSNENISAKKNVGYITFELVRKIFVFLLSALIVIGAFLFATSHNPNKSMFGYRYYTVLTDSMSPEFSSGDMIIVKLLNADTIKTGDVITFNPSSGSEAYLTHRVTEKIEDYQGTGVTCFRTKGDANNTDDSFLIDESRVIGKVQFHVPKMGTVMRFFQLRWYFVVPLFLLGIVFFELMKYYFSLQDEKNKPQNANK